MSTLRKNTPYFKDADRTIAQVAREMRAGFKLLNTVNRPIVTFFGSHRVGAKHRDFKQCEGLAYELGSLGYAIVTGGGPGIMRAANEGAMRANTDSVGLKAALLTGEQMSAGVFTRELDLKFLFVRRFLLAIKSDVLVFYPGGYGTLNELFEYLTLMETKIVDVVPIICINKKFWQGLFRWLQRTPLRRDLLQRKKSLNLVTFVDTIAEATSAISAREADLRRRK